ncbi:hypothetical protein BH23ACT2_BH23ACT2_15250 [soil metagenome]
MSEHTTPADEANAASHRPGGALFWVSMAVGAAITGYGVLNLVDQERRALPSVARWFVGGALLVDLVVVPLGAALGLLAKRLLPALLWPVVRAALLASVVLVVFATPLVLDQGGVPGDPSLRPRDYSTGLTVALATVWAVAALVGAGRLAAARRRR